MTHVCVSGIVEKYCFRPCQPVDRFVIQKKNWNLFCQLPLPTTFQKHSYTRPTQTRISPRLSYYSLPLI
jgi:hypothetical protein